MSKKEKKEKKGFWKEFKEFISRGNVLDMAVGVIIAGAFTAIVTAMSENILKPIINWILAAMLGKDSLSEVYTFLVRGYDENGVLDLTQSIYIDWGSFINAIINFILIALVLFCIIKVMTKVQRMRDEVKENVKEAIEQRKSENATEGAGTDGESEAPALETTEEKTE